MKRALGVVIVPCVLVGVWLIVTRPETPSDEAIQLGASEVPARPDDAFPVTVVSVWDGDTLHADVDSSHPGVAASDDVRVRLIGIDTPEVSDPAECWSAEAKAQLTTLAPVGTRLWAAFDDDPRDRYDRLLLYLWTEDGRFINHELVATGSAETMTIAPNDAYAALFAADEARARAAGAGQWGGCP
ncbi:thermonuclease family protein [Microbacterium sp. AZCO]|uniref:thermonuclease family protein n=1 Tax=Microbacterium sp. AZCO TaxID=3142976 RepID=UPI0031F3D22B